MTGIGGLYLWLVHPSGPATALLTAAAVMAVVLLVGALAAHRSRPRRRDPSLDDEQIAAVLNSRNAPTS